MKNQLYCGDCRDLAIKHIEPESVDLIFTDPPYSQEYFYLYEWLAKEAVRALRPNGFLFAYCGPYHKDKVMGFFGDHLKYFYDFVLVHTGNTSILWPRKIISGYKSILCYHKKKEKPLPVTNVLGKWNGSGSDKRYHRWGQEEITAQYYIDCFSKNGALVVDYFLGAGTFGAVCKRLRRRFVGFELEKDVFETAKERIENANTELEYDQIKMFK